MRRLQYVALLTKFYLFDSDYSKYRFLIKSRYYTHTKTCTLLHAKTACTWENSHS